MKAPNMCQYTMMLAKGLVNGVLAILGPIEGWGFDPRSASVSDAKTALENIRGETFSSTKALDKVLEPFTDTLGTGVFAEPDASFLAILAEVRAAEEEERKKKAAHRMRIRDGLRGLKRFDESLDIETAGEEEARAAWERAKAADMDLPIEERGRTFGLAAVLGDFSAGLNICDMFDLNAPGYDTALERFLADLMRMRREDAAGD